MQAAPIKLNLGCGAQVADGWINVDYALGARLMTMPFAGALLRPLKLFNINWDSRIVIHDLRLEFPWKTGVASAIYSSHTLEHLDRESGESFLKECHRVLMRGGVIRIVVPDLEKIVERYRSEALPAERFLEEMQVLRGRPPRSILKRFLWPYVGFPHQCMYDHASLTRVMRAIGFRCQTKGYSDSSIPNIHEIELRDRTVDAVIVEGHKP